MELKALQVDTFPVQFVVLGRYLPVHDVYPNLEVNGGDNGFGTMMIPASVKMRGFESGSGTHCSP